MTVSQKNVDTCLCKTFFYIFRRTLEMRVEISERRYAQVEAMTLCLELL